MKHPRAKCRVHSTCWRGPDLFRVGLNDIDCIGRFHNRSEPLPKSIEHRGGLIESQVPRHETSQLDAELAAACADFEEEIAPLEVAEPRDGDSDAPGDAGGQAWVGFIDPGIEALRIHSSHHIPHRSQKGRGTLGCAGASLSTIIVHAQRVCSDFDYDRWIAVRSLRKRVPNSGTISFQAAGS